MKDENGIVNFEGGQKPKKLLDRVREVLRIKHYSIRTEEAYTGWIVRLHSLSQQETSQGYGTY